MSELKHSGKKGMKWHVRRYQPYPKDYTGEGVFLNSKGNKNHLKPIEQRPETKPNANGKTDGITRIKEKIRSEINEEHKNWVVRTFENIRKMHNDALNVSINKVMKKEG